MGSGTIPVLESKNPESAFSGEQLRDYAKGRLDDPELIRRMDDDLLNHPEGEVNSYLREMVHLADTALEIDVRRLLNGESEQVSETEAET